MILKEKLKDLQELKKLGKLKEMVEKMHSRKAEDWKVVVRTLGDRENCGHAVKLLKESIKEKGRESTKLVSQKDYDRYGPKSWMLGKKYLERFGITNTYLAMDGTFISWAAPFKTLGTLLDFLEAGYEGWKEKKKRPLFRWEGAEAARLYLIACIMLKGGDSNRVPSMEDLEKIGMDPIVIKRAKQHLVGLLSGGCGSYVCEVMMDLIEKLLFLIILIFAATWKS